MAGVNINNIEVNTYPYNLTSVDPVAKEARPYMTFIASELKIDFSKARSYDDFSHMEETRGAFALPLPNGSLSDSVSHTYSQDNPLMNPVLGLMPDVVKNITSQTTGKVPDPLLTQIYQGSTPRSFTAEWQLIPQNKIDAENIMKIIKQIKFLSSPGKINAIDVLKVGALEQPCVWRIEFVGGVLQDSTRFNLMVLENYSIDYFGQGYSSTYQDSMPKQIKLSLTFKEFGLKYKNDWMDE